MNELRRLLSRPDTTVERAALALSSDARPALDVEATLAHLDELAAPLGDLSRLPSAAARARALSDRLHGELGFAGNAQDYYDPWNSYLDRVLERRVGIPISLSVLWMAVGRRARVHVEGVGFPGHFFVRVGGERGVHADPFAGGRVVDGPHLAALVQRFVGDPRHMRPELMAPVGVEAIVVRMLANLGAAYRRSGDHARRMLVCDRLVELTGQPEHVRDRGLSAFGFGSYLTAVEDLAAYLVARPAARDVAHVRGVLDRARSLAGRNLQ